MYFKYKENCAPHVFTTSDYNRYSNSGNLRHKVLKMQITCTLFKFQIQ